MPKCPVTITAVAVRTIGGERDTQSVVVEVELDGRWVELLREPATCGLSHIIEGWGILSRAGDGDGAVKL